MKLRDVIESRELTFLGGDDEYSTSYDGTWQNIVLLVGFVILAIAFSVIALLTLRVTSTCQEFYERKSINILMPALSLYMASECATLALKISGATILSSWASFLYFLDAFVAPGIFLYTFVLTFLAYQIRSMPFCFVYRRREDTSGGGNIKDGETGGALMEPLVQPRILVYGMCIFALCLLVCSLIVNFDVLWSEPNLAGKTGWATVVTNLGDPSATQVALALLPMALSVGFCTYFALILWKYGCELSLTIYSSFINPWMFPTVGVVAMAAGQLVGPNLFPILSNAGVCVYMMSMLRLLYEIRGDLAQSADLGNFLGAVWTEPDPSKLHDKSIWNGSSLRVATPSAAISAREPHSFCFSLL
jgi:hypothetical protein